MEQPPFQSFRHAATRPFATPSTGSSHALPFGAPDALGADRLNARARAAGTSPLDTVWIALHDAARAVAMLAGRGPEPLRPEVRNFPAIMRSVGGWRAECARQGIEDLAAMLQPGLRALLAAQARTAPDGLQSAAQVLWHEFDSARAALLDLIPPLNLKPQR